MEIPEAIACEVQIRTLLQHAHSELTHDSIYKPTTVAKPDVKRTVAKSMALIEATDDYFVKAMSDLDKASEDQRDLLNFLAEKYLKCVGRSPNLEASNKLVIDAFSDILSAKEIENDIDRFLLEKPFVCERIIERYDSQFFYTLPIVILAYYLTDTHRHQTKSLWPTNQRDLLQVFSDLSIAYDRD